MRSMTGYGEGEEKTEGGKVYLEIKTINDRFLKIDIISSAFLSFNLERKIKKYIEKEINRGGVFVRIKIKERPSYKLIINKNLLRQYYETFFKLSRELELKEKPSLGNLLKLPEIISIDKEEERISEEVIEKALKKALKEVIFMREEEGEKHQISIYKSIEKIKKEIIEIEKKTPLCEKIYRERIEKELKKFLPEDKEKIAKEILSSINHNNINEEKIRIGSHLHQLKQALKRKRPTGKRIEFILRELQREANTMGAKIVSFPISSHIIKIKEEIEKIKELNQNIE